MKDEINKIRENLKRCVDDSGLSLGEISRLTGGIVTKSSLQRYITGATKKIPMDSIAAIERALNLETGTIMGWESDNLQSVSLDKEYGTIKVPVYGRIPAGQPLEAIEDVIGYEEISAKWAKGGKEFFALEIKGDSMYPEYHSGDIIIFIKQPVCENGQDCAVAINGDEWTFKRVEKNADGVIIKPLNPAYETKFYSNKDVAELPVEIKGVIWELRRNMRKR